MKKTLTIKLKNKRSLKICKIFILFIIFWLLFFGIGKCEATNYYSIENCVVTIDPKINENTYNYLNIRYEITCKVLDSEKPISCIKINTLDNSNGYFEKINNISDNVKNISSSEYLGISGVYSPYIIVFLSKEYNYEETFTFQYSINKYTPPKRTWSKCSYNFSPYSFINLELDNITLKWNKTKVKNNKFQKQKDNYLIWNNINKDDNIKIQYKRKDFPFLNKEISVIDDIKYDIKYALLTIIISIILILFFYLYIMERKYQRTRR